MPAARDRLPVAVPPFSARVSWASGGRLGAETRRELALLVDQLAPILSDLEAEAEVAARKASCGFEWLLPRLEVTLPLYGRGRVFRLRIARDEETEMSLLTRSGRRVGSVHLSR